MNGDLFRAICKHYMELRHIRTLEQLRHRTTTVSNKTFLKWWHSPDLMPMGTMIQIMDCLNVPYEDRCKIFK